jgi:hypothetical protein
MRKLKNQSVQLHQVPEQVAQFDAFCWHQSEDIQALLLLHQLWPLRSQPHWLRTHFFAVAVVVVVVDDVTVVSGWVVVVLVVEAGVVVEVLEVVLAVVEVLVVVEVVVVVVLGVVEVVDVVVLGVVVVVDAVVLVVVKDPPGPSKGHQDPIQVSQLDWLALQKSLIIWW